MITNLGKIDKLQIQPFKDPGYQDSAGEAFTAMINPETYTYKYKNEFCETQAPGSSGAALKFNKMPPQEFGFDFLFDGTGVVKDASVLSIAIANPFDEKSRDITKQLDAFKNKVLDYQGDKHRPWYLKIIWGPLLFKGLLITMDIEYKLFNPDGTPLRAVAKCSFKGSINDEQRIARDDPQSPDITHKRIFSAADKIYLLSKDIYSDENYYIDVAKANGFDNFRDIKAGTVVHFFPFEK